MTPNSPLGTSENRISCGTPSRPRPRPRPLPPLFAWPHRLLITAGVAGELFLCGVLLLGACGGCESPLRTMLSALGVLFYAAMAVLTLLMTGWTMPKQLLLWGLSLAFAVHAALGLLMIYRGLGCWLCACAALLALYNFSLACWVDPRCLKRFAVALPLASLVLGLTVLPSAIRADAWSEDAVTVGGASAPVTDRGTVSITVFESNDCPYCRELKERVLPQFAGDPSLSVVRFLDAGLFGLIDRVPLIVLRGADRKQVIEGLPTVELLRSAIDQVRKEAE